MAKYDVTYSCGHSGIVELVGKGSERERKIKFFEECGLCPECYKKKKQEEKSNEPFQLEIRIQPFHRKPFQIVFISGDTKSHKDNIKELGFKWAEINVDSYIIPNIEYIMHNTYAWCKNVNEDEIEAECKKVAEPLPNVLEKVHRGYTNRELLAYKMSKEMFKNVIYPEKPSCYPKGYWNGSFYKAKDGNRRIYVDKTEVLISESDALLIENYQKEIKEYKKQVKQIEETVLSEL